VWNRGAMDFYNDADFIFGDGKKKRIMKTVWAI
jgi:hypothetical protein